MVVVDVVNTLNPFINNLSQNELSVAFLHTLSVFALNAVSYFYILIKFYKVLCYSKMTFEWLPMINPYVWPFSVFHVLTGPYFALWARILPSIKFEKSSVEISGIIALESLNSFIYFCVRTVNFLIGFLEQLEKTIETDTIE